MTPRSHAPFPASAAGTVLAVCLLALCVTAGCGKKGMPTPPVRVLPEPVKDLQVRQTGDELLVSFRRPSSRTDGTPLPDASDLVLFMTAREPVPRAPREIVESPAVSWTIAASRWGEYARGGVLEIPIRLASVAAALEMPGGPAALAGRRLSFAVQVREPGRRRSTPAGVGTVAVCAAPDPPPRVEAAPEEGGVRVRWDAPGGGAPREGFRVLRRAETPGAEQRTLTPVPVTEPSFLDTAYPPGQAVRYVVRAVAKGTPQCESGEAASGPVTWVDRFPPAAPQGLAAVQEQGAIRLFWRPNREADLRGYLVYRAEGPGGELKRLTDEPVAATSWTDAAVSPDIVYSYAVTAVDSAQPANESPKSERATEQLEGPR